MTPAIHLSVVSHGQAELVHPLLRDLAQHCSAQALQVTLTLNLPEQLPFAAGDFPFPLEVVNNTVPQGFGANHNAAFGKGKGCPYFCVINPDIRLHADVFAPLVAAIEPNTGIIAPLVRNPAGGVEDSARRLPTPLSILAKAFGHVETPESGERPEWVAGMFMLFPSMAFQAIGGFDPRYHLYYEDVDICCRLRLADYAIHLLRQAEVTHAARRESRRNPRYLRWHLASMARFFTSRTFFSCLIK